MSMTTYSRYGPPRQCQHRRTSHVHDNYSRYGPPRQCQHRRTSHVHDNIQSLWTTTSMSAQENLSCPGQHTVVMDHHVNVSTGEPLMSRTIYSRYGPPRQCQHRRTSHVQDNIQSLWTTTSMSAQENLSCPGQLQSLWTTTSMSAPENLSCPGQHTVVMDHHVNVSTGEPLMSRTTYSRYGPPRQCQHRRTSHVQDNIQSLWTTTSMSAQENLSCPGQHTVVMDHHVNVSTGEPLMSRTTYSRYGPPRQCQHRRTSHVHDNIQSLWTTTSMSAQENLSCPGQHTVVMDHHVNVSTGEPLMSRTTYSRYGPPRQCQHRRTSHVQDNIQSLWTTTSMSAQENLSCPGQHTVVMDHHVNVSTGEPLMSRTTYSRYGPPRQCQHRRTSHVQDNIQSLWTTTSMSAQENLSCPGQHTVVMDHHVNVSTGEPLMSRTTYSRYGPPRQCQHRRTSHVQDNIQSLWTTTSMSAQENLSCPGQHTVVMDHHVNVSTGEPLMSRTTYSRYGPPRQCQHRRTSHVQDNIQSLWTTTSMSAQENLSCP